MGLTLCFIVHRSFPLLHCARVSPSASLCTGLSLCFIVHRSLPLLHCARVSPFASLCTGLALCFIVRFFLDWLRGGISPPLKMFLPPLSFSQFSLEFFFKLFKKLVIINTCKWLLSNSNSSRLSSPNSHNLFKFFI